MKKIFIHKARSFKDAEEFDRKFWRKAGSHARFASAFDCLRAYIKIGGGNERLLRLRRSVQNIERKES